MFLTRLILLSSAITLAACVTANSEVEITEVAVDDLPANVAQLVTSTRAGFTPEEVLKKVRDGRVYYDIEGELADGSELEFDVLMTDTGPEIVEIQRDVSFETLPQAVRSQALKTSKSAMPARIIESLQPNNTIIYEFFSAGQPKDPAYEIRWDGNEASVLEERFIH